jgi:hypothetical protein
MQARRGSVLVQIETDARVIGIRRGRYWRRRHPRWHHKVLEPMLIGEDPLLIEPL